MLFLLVTDLVHFQDAYERREEGTNAHGKYRYLLPPSAFAVERIDHRKELLKLYRIEHHCVVAIASVDRYLLLAQWWGFRQARVPTEAFRHDVF
jgi:hypothetical protein